MTASSGDAAGAGGGRDRSRARVIRLAGAPGAGKTTALLNHVDELAAQGYSPKDIYYLTFTRSGRDEVKDGLVDIFTEWLDDHPDESAETIHGRARTVHGAACVACMIGDIIVDVGEQIIDPSKNPGVYREFCRPRGLSFSPETTNPLQLVYDEREIEHAGNRLFALSNWLKYQQKPIRKHGQAPPSLGLHADDATVALLLREWDEYKREAFDLPLFEHADYVDRAIQDQLLPPANVLFIDEFQDLSPQEYRLFKVWRDSGQIERIYIAGDVFQSIYGFRASTPLYFGQTPTDENEVLVESYRCPAEVVRVARGIIDATPPGADHEGIDADTPRFRARFEGGTAERVSIDRAEDLAEALRADRDAHQENDEGNTIFVLARTNRQVGMIADALDAEGLIYSSIGGRMKPWGLPLPDLLRALAAIDRGQDLRHSPADVQQVLLSYMPEGVADSRLESGADDDLRQLSQRSPRSIIGDLDLNYHQRERLRNAIRRGSKAVMHELEAGEQAIKLGTIHSAKGLQAPCVYLFDAYSERMVDRYYSGETAAEEHRLYYVGSSRASRTLRVVTDFPDLGERAFPPFERGLPRADLTEVLS